MTRTKFSLLRCVFAVATLICASLAYADHLPDNLLAKGKADTKLCGFDPYLTPLKDIVSKLGKPDRIVPWEVNKTNVTYEWTRGPLTIRVDTYQFEDYLDQPPVYIEVAGNDPDKFCTTGRGLKLNDTLADVRKLYGRRYQLTREDSDTRLITIQWSTNATVFVSLDNDGHVKAINVPGLTE